MGGLLIEVPMRTVPGMNTREHWRARSRRVRGEKASIAWHLASAKVAKPALPCVVVLTRIAPSAGLDDDNLAGALKSVRDAVASWLGVDDKLKDIVRYEPRQERGPWGVRVEVA